MRSVLVVAILASLGCSAAAQSSGAMQAAPPRSAACPPDVNGGSATVGEGKGSEPLSDKLAQSKGVICPPAGLDPQMQVNPPGGGRLKVIPPPGTPGGDPNVQPK